MIKKIVILLGLILIILLSVNLYIKRTQAVECWWGVMYRSLSFIALEDEEETVRYSSLDNHFYVEQEPEIKYDFMFFKWLKQKFSF